MDAGDSKHNHINSVNVYSKCKCIYRKPEMSTFKQTNSNRKQILSGYVIHMKGAFLSEDLEISSQHRQLHLCSRH